MEEALPPGWEDVRLTLTTEQPGDLARASQVLGPMGAGRLGNSLVLHVRRAGGPQAPEAARRLFRRLDEERIWCVLRRDDVVAPAAERATPAAHAPLAAQWTAQLDALPAHWGSVLLELELESTDLLPRVALLCAPLNPVRAPGKRAFTCRAARRAGYGASPGMVRRCLERCDQESIRGRLSLLALFPETDNVATQGPVFPVGGHAL